MARWPSPGPRAVTGARPGGQSSQGCGNRGPRIEKGGSSEDHLEVSSADFCFTQSRSGRCGNGHHQMGGGVSPEPIGQSRAPTRPQPAEFRQAEMGARRGLGYPSERA
jgi:hypothetical protein